MRLGFRNLVFWVAVILVTVTCAWGQGAAPARVPTHAEAVAAFNSLAGIVPHYAGSLPEIEAERARQVQAFRVLGAYLNAQDQYATVEKPGAAADKDAKPEAKKKRGK